MSLLTAASAMTGDIWSTGAFSFESPLKDLLDSGDYTLEQLLAEDELLQELRGIHPILTTYFSSEQSVTQLLKYVTLPPKTEGTASSDNSRSDANTTSSAPQTPMNGNRMQGDDGDASPTPVSPDVPPSPDVTSKTTTIANDDGGVELEAVSKEKKDDPDGEASRKEAEAEQQQESSEEEQVQEPAKWLLAQLEKKIPLTDSSANMIEGDEDEKKETSASGKSKHPEEDPEMLYIRFPFMACEIICCEIEGVIETLVEGHAVLSEEQAGCGSRDNTDGGSAQTKEQSKLNCSPKEVKQRKKITHETSETSPDCPDGSEGVEVLQVEQPASPRSPDSQTEKKDDEGDNAAENNDDDQRPRLLDLLFGVLVDTPAGQLDDYRAGYFDKILTVLFRKRPAQMRDYINRGGMYGKALMIQCMMRHLYSQSIMQIAQRLLLPPRPTAVNHMGNSAEEEEGSEGTGRDENDVATDGEDGTAEGGDGDDDNDEGGGQDILTGEEDDEEGDNGMGIKCDWSNSTEALSLLLQRLLDPDGSEGMSDADKLSAIENNLAVYDEQRLAMSLNASEVLITIIQNSMLSSETMLSLTSAETLQRLTRAAITLLPSPEHEGPYFSPHESLLTSAMNVIESLILQLGGYGAVGTMAILTPEEEAAAAQAQMDDGDVAAHMPPPPPPAPPGTSSGSGDKVLENENNESTSIPTDEHEGEEVVDDAISDGAAPLIADLTNLLLTLPEMLDGFSKLLRHPSTKSWTSAAQFSQSEESVQLLGTSRLRIVRVLESLVLLGDPAVDSVLVQSDCLKTCLELFWEFPWCSMLHQSVANLLVHVFEGQNVRFEIQEYFLEQCNLMGRLMESFVETIDSANISGVSSTIPPAPAADDDDGAEQPVSPRTQDVGDGESDADRVVSNAVLDLEKAVSNANATSAVARAALAALMTPDAAAALRAEEDAEEAAAEGASSSPDRLPVSEDDVDAAIEQQQEEDAAASAGRDDEVEMASTEAVQQESQDGISDSGLIGAPAQSFRLGYMGHVIIICQALVQACSNEWGADPSGDDMSHQTGETGESNERSFSRQTSGGASQASVSVGESTNGTGDISLLIADLVKNHELADRWIEFVATTLSSEIAIQSTPLGGIPVGPDTSMMHDPLSQSLEMGGAPIPGGRRPGLADDDGDMVGSGAAPPPPPRGIYGGGDIIDMDDNDLEVAAQMMAGLGLGNIRRQGPKSMSLDGRIGGNDSDEGSGEFSGSGDSEKSYNSGETAREKGGYLFDDPLGKAGGLGIELGKLTQYKADDDSDEGVRGEVDADDGNSSSSSSSQEPPRNDSSDDEEDDTVPVMDLFAGNFSGSQNSAAPPDGFGDFANFASFEGNFGDSGDAAASLNDSTDAIVDGSGGGDGSEASAKSAEIEAIFGEGDHASLLEAEVEEIKEVPADAATSASPRDDSAEAVQESMEVQPNETPHKIPDDPITGKEPQPAPFSPPSVDIPDIPTAPSDELQADAKSISALTSIGGLSPVNATKSVIVEPDPAASDEVVKPEDAQSEEPEVLA